jgi:tetratricopeptide (TPR) repeat protein
MTATTTKPARRAHSAPLERLAAARLLRCARAADPMREPLVIERAYSAMPDRRWACLLMIRSLLDRRELAAAESMLEAQLLRRPMCPIVSRLHARCLMLQGRLDEARREIAFTLRLRPRHIEVLLVAAGIAAMNDNHTWALQLLLRARGRAPERADLIEAACAAHLALGHWRRARALLAKLAAPPPRLAIDLLRARGHLSEAIALADAHVARLPRGIERDEIAVLLMDMLATSGQWPRVLRLAGRLGPSAPNALIRAAAALLTIGRIDASLALLDRLPEDARQGDEARAIRLVANSAAHPGGELALAVSAARRRIADADAARIGHHWRQALLGAFARNTAPAGRFGPDTDDDSDPLIPLVRRALVVLDRHAAQAEPAGTGPDLAACRARCRAVLEDAQTRS